MKKIKQVEQEYNISIEQFKANLNIAKNEVGYNSLTKNEIDLINTYTNLKIHDLAYCINYEDYPGDWDLFTRVVYDEFKDYMVDLDCEMDIIGRTSSFYIVSKDLKYSDTTDRNFTLNDMTILQTIYDNVINGDDISDYINSDFSLKLTSDIDYIEDFIYNLDDVTIDNIKDILLGFINIIKLHTYIQDFKDNQIMNYISFYYSDDIVDTCLTDIKNLKSKIENNSILKDLNITTDKIEELEKQYKYLLKKTKEFENTLYNESEKINDYQNSYIEVMYNLDNSWNNLSESINNNRIVTIIELINSNNLTIDILDNFKMFNKDLNIDNLLKYIQFITN